MKGEKDMASQRMIPEDLKGRMRFMPPTERNMVIEALECDLMNVDRTVKLEPRLEVVYVMLSDMMRRRLA